MARKFALISDNGCDLPAEYFSEHEVDCVKLGFTLNGETYGEDGGVMDEKEFYDLLRNGAMPKTFQATPAQAYAHIEPFVKEGKDVLIVAFSSGLSGTCESYVTAAKEISEKYPSSKVFVVDSLCASCGEGMFLDYVVKKADTGASIEETVAYAEDLKLHICHYFTVNDLFHLKRGGRVSGATAAIGSLLRIKPVMHVDNEGHLIAFGKTMGRRKAISILVDKMSELQILEADDPIYISHGDCMDDVDYLISLLKDRFGERKIVVNMIGSVIGTHSGAGTLAVFFRGKNR